MPSRPALGPNQPPIQWVPGDLSLVVKLITNLQLVPKSRKRGSIHSLPHTSSWHSAYLVKHRDNFTFYHFTLAVGHNMFLYSRVKCNSHLNRSPAEYKWKASPLKVTVCPVPRYVETTYMTECSMLKEVICNKENSVHVRKYRNQGHNNQGIYTVNWMYLKNTVFWNVALCSLVRLPTFHRNILPGSSGSKFKLTQWASNHILLKQPHSLRPVWSSYIYCLHTPLHVSVF
jgi:hypothetical protein